MVWKYKIRISKHMYGYFNPEVYIFRLFGIFPFTTQKNSAGIFFKWSPWHTLYSYLLSLLLIGASLIEAIIGMFFLKGGVKLDIINNTDNFVWLFTVSIYCLATFLVTFVTPKEFRKLCGYFKCINQVEEIQINSDQFKINFDFASGILILDTTVVTGSIIVTYFSNDNFSRAIYSIMVRVVPFALHVYIGNVVQHMIRLMIRILNLKFVSLNQALEREFQKIKNSDLISERNPQRRTNFKANLNNFVSLQHDFSNEKLLVLTKAYLKLMEAAKILNNHFGLIILILMASSLFQLISTPYHIILSLEGKRRGIAETLRRLIKFSEQLLRVLILIEPIYDCTLKMQDIAQQVCNILSLNIEDKYRKQVDTFAMCICLNQFKFSAWGCFDVDRFLLSSLVGTVTTYVCILLQAQESETE